ncbi:MAG: hypothetical protein R3E66_00260 [bacterium]
MEFPETILGVTRCGEKLFVVAGRTVWRVGVDGRKEVLLPRLAGEGVRFVYCTHDNEMMILEDVAAGTWKALYLSSLTDDAYRVSKFYLPEDHDFRRVTEHELLYSTYMYGRWYVNRGTVLEKRIDHAILAHGRFPISCGADCIYFITQSDDGYEVRRLQGQTETLIQPLPQAMPWGLERLNDRFVIAYDAEVYWPDDQTRVAIPSGVSQLLVWQERLLIVSKTKLLMISHLH